MRRRQGWGWASCFWMSGRQAPSRGPAAHRAQGMFSRAALPHRKAQRVVAWVEERAPQPFAHRHEPHQQQNCQAKTGAARAQARHWAKLPADLQERGRGVAVGTAAALAAWGRPPARRVGGAVTAVFLSGGCFSHEDSTRGYHSRARPTSTQQAAQAMKMAVAVASPKALLLMLTSSLAIAAQRAKLLVMAAVADCQVADRGLSHCHNVCSLLISREAAVCRLSPR
jgi:hypothetical protein